MRDQTDSSASILAEMREHAREALGRETVPPELSILAQDVLALCIRVEDLERNGQLAMDPESLPA